MLISLSESKKCKTTDESQAENNDEQAKGKQSELL
jgi:hypothetical protein